MFDSSLLPAVALARQNEILRKVERDRFVRQVIAANRLSKRADSHRRRKSWRAWVAAAAALHNHRGTAAPANLLQQVSK